MTDYADRETGVAAAAAMLSDEFLPNLEVNATLNAESRRRDGAAIAEACSRLSVPTLIVHGTEDPRPAWAVDELVAALPRSRMVLLEGAGHLPWVEQPGAFAEAVRGFLEVASAAGS
jgi:proline iminopeptidase